MIAVINGWDSRFFFFFAEKKSRKEVQEKKFEFGLKNKKALFKMDNQI